MSNFFFFYFKQGENTRYTFIPKSHKFQKQLLNFDCFFFKNLIFLSTCKRSQAFQVFFRIHFVGFNITKTRGKFTSSLLKIVVTFSIKIIFKRRSFCFFTFLTKRNHSVDTMFLQLNFSIKNRNYLQCLIKFRI